MLPFCSCIVASFGTILFFFFFSSTSRFFFFFLLVFGFFSEESAFFSLLFSGCHCCGSAAACLLLPVAALCNCCFILSFWSSCKPAGDDIVALYWPPLFFSRPLLLLHSFEDKFFCETFLRGRDAYTVAWLSFFFLSFLLHQCHLSFYIFF